MHYVLLALLCDTALGSWNLFEHSYALVLFTLSFRHRLCTQLQLLQRVGKVCFVFIILCNDGFFVRYPYLLGFSFLFQLLSPATTLR